MSDDAAFRTPHADLQPFVFPDTAQQVRVIQVSDQPWFVAADVCAVLEIRNTADAVSALDDDEKGVATVDTLGGSQRLSIISEPGLYSLILRSRKPEAKAFKRWVVHEVLPAIRRTGGYGRPAVDLSAISRRDLASWLVESEDARELAERRTAELEAVTEAMAPKVDAFDAFMEADGTYAMATVGNMIGIGRTTLFARLRDEGILKADNTPYQRYAHYFKVIGGSHDENGREVKHLTTRVRPPGVDLIRRRLFPPGQLTIVS